MPPDQINLPALPILLPLGVVLMVVSVVLLRRAGLLTGPRLAAAWAGGWYAVAVLGATFLPLKLSWGPDRGPAYLYRIILVPLTTMRPDDFVLNIAMTLPLAALLYVLFGVTERSRVVLAGFLLSLTIEVTQGVMVLVAHGTRWADVNDLISNTLGGFLGYLLFRWLLGFATVRRVVASCRIPVREEAHRAVTRS
jgi:glycopeptide antibiotics resistance protein